MFSEHTKKRSWLVSDKTKGHTAKKLSEAGRNVKISSFNLLLIV